jgi:uncharacterized protein (TIGR03435 family)
MLAPRARRLTFLAVCAFAFVCPAFPQPPAPPEPGGPPPYTPTLTFDVASIRETTQPDASWQMGLNSQLRSCSFTANGITPRVLLGAAYGFGAYQISGAPDWLESTFWVVQARCDHSIDDQLAKLTDDQAKLEKQHMMQALLADRFHLKVHWETKQATVNALVIANPKSGSKLQPTKVEIPDPSIPNAPPPETKGADIQSQMDAHGHVMTVSHITPTGIAALLSAMLRTTVEDKTGLTGRYDLTLKYTYQSTDPDSYPTLTTAIQEQLGLKLQSTRGPVDVLVIDHMDRPTDN